MTLEVGNLVTRYKYNHDVVFKILSIKNETAYLKGVNVRLYADAPLEAKIAIEKKSIKMKMSHYYLMMTVEIIFSFQEKYFILMLIKII